MKNYKAYSFSSGLKYSISKTIDENKGKIVLTIALVLISIFTGVFVAIKTNSSFGLGQLQEISLTDFYTGFVASSSAFTSRFFSHLLNLLLLVAFSFSNLTIFLAEILFVYRGYLFGLNFTLIFIFYGLGSVLSAVIIILPCQLLTFAFFILFYFSLLKINLTKQKYGICETNRFLFVCLGILMIFLLNLIETILLVLLNGRVILVI